MNDRERALSLLRRIEREELFASLVLAEENAFVRTLVLGVLRWRSRLDHAIVQLSGRPLKKLDRAVVEILRIGLYQLHFMRVPDHAAVSESVDLAARHAHRARGLVNAVLRRAAKGLPDADLATRLAHPPWLVERWIGQFGQERAARILEANQELSQPDVLVIDGPPPVGSTPSQLVPGVVRCTGSTSALDRRLYYPMDEGSAVIAAIAASAGSEVLDLAAAPGGKSIYMDWCGATVTSSDASLIRLRPLRGHSRRLIVSDGRHPPFRKQFQSVLIDAPCSATGTIRKNPEIKWRLTAAEIESFVPLQRELLRSAMRLARERVVYSTCSLEREENEAVIEWALREEPGFTLDDAGLFAPAGAQRWIESGVLRLTPDSGADGFTAFVLRKG